jgi:pimeloyl-ACP methyl ester carboxylesterase
LTTQVHIPDSELSLLQRKLELARLPTSLENEEWGEPNGVIVKMMIETVKFWREQYDWRAEEARLNVMPQFKTSIDVNGFGTLNIHFVHAVSSKPNAVPLLFLHGWPGSFAEVEKILPSLTEARYNVVSPSLPGYGFSSYTDKAGFKHEQHAEVMNKLMMKLGYNKYVVQGGDWGSFIAGRMARMYPKNVKALHANMVLPSSNTSNNGYTNLPMRTS